MSVCDLPLKDSGERREFESGAVRSDSAGKGRYDLLPPHAIHRLAVTLEKGCKKYGERNWERGVSLSRYVDSALRHLSQYLAGDDDEDHFAQALWNVACGIQTEQWAIEGKVPANVLDLPRHETLREQIEIEDAGEFVKDEPDSQGPDKPLPPVVVKIGLWRQRNGVLAAVESYKHGSSWPWIGQHHGGRHCSWTVDGAVDCMNPHPHDLIEYLGPLED
jgi:hypothetical protein